jgi:hypothetical protein
VKECIDSEFNYNAKCIILISILNDENFVINYEELVRDFLTFCDDSKKGEASQEDLSNDFSESQKEDAPCEFPDMDFDGFFMSLDLDIV